MKRKAFLCSLLCLGLIARASISFSQESLQISVDPWTTKSGEKSTYYKMLEWDTSPYKEFTYMKRRGPNSWDIEEYMNFRILFPKGYDSSIKDGKRYPLIVFLHGAGESGIKWTDHFDYVNGYEDTPPEPEKIDNNDHQLRFGGKEFLAARNRPEGDPRAFHGFFVFPQIPFNGSWASAYDKPLSSYNRQVIELVEILISKYKIDPNKIYVMGLSNGARGVWDLINRRPDLFAAGIAMSGAGDPYLMAERLAHFPIWIFQGGEDDNPAPSSTYQMVDALKEEGGSPRLTVYEDLGHGVWNTAFTEPDFFSWLLSKSKLSIYTFYQKSHFKTLDSVNAKLSVSPGFSSYQWKYNGEVLENSDNNIFIAQKLGTYQVRFQRGNEWTAWSDPVFITSDEEADPSELPIVYRINIGATSIPTEPQEWSADSESQPSPYLVSKGTKAYQKEFLFHNYTGAPDELFESGRKGNSDAPSIQYKLPFQGKGLVTLYFAKPETQNEEGLNQVIFNINLEGKTVTDHFNLLKVAAGDATKKTFQVNISDGSLDIALESVEGYPVLSGIEVRRNNVITSVEEENKTPHFVVYPNPFNTRLNVALTNTNLNAENIIIRDLHGEIVFKKEWNQHQKEMDLNPFLLNLSSGLYFLELRFKYKKSQLLKIIKL